MGKVGTQILGRLGQSVGEGKPGPENPDDKANIPLGLWQVASLPRTPGSLPSPLSVPCAFREDIYKCFAEFKEHVDLAGLLTLQESLCLVGLGGGQSSHRVPEFSRCFNYTLESHIHPPE